MARESCIAHTGDMVVIRQDFVRLCGGSHSHAAVLDCLEFLTNGRIALLEISEDFSDPWVEASAYKLADGCVGLYGRTTLLRCLQDLINCGMVDVKSAGRGTNNHYLLNYRRISKLLISGSVLELEKKEHSSSELDPNSPKLNADQSTPESKIEPANKEYAVRIQNAETHTSVGSFSEMPIEGFIRVFFSKYKQGRGTHLDSQRQDKRKTIDWLTELSETQDEILNALAMFLDDDYWRKDKFPLPGFRKQFQIYLDQCRKPAVEDPVCQFNGNTFVAVSGSGIDPNGAARVVIASPDQFAAWCEGYKSIGASWIQSDFDKALPRWNALSAEDHEKAIAHVVTCDPAFIKSPRNYLADREFERKPRPKPKTAIERAMENA